MIPPSIEVIKQILRDHIKQHFDVPSELVNRLNVIAEIPCHCEHNSLLICFVCDEILVARVQTDAVCNCVRGLLNG